MTSVDSGIETSNNSDDNPIGQNEDISADEISNVGSAVATITTTSNIREIKPSFRIELGSDWRIACWSGARLPFSPYCGLSNENFKYPSEVENSTASSSGPVTYSNNSDSILELACLGNPTLLKKKKTVYRKLKSSFYYETPFAERKMRVAAATNNTIAMRKLLFTARVSPNNHDEQGRTPLHLASCRGYTKIVRLLLEHGADPNRRDCVNNTPLHLAAAASKIEVVTLLLNAGADLLSLDREGYSPLQLAQTKLELLQNCKREDMLKVKEEVQNVKSMLLAYLQKQKDAHKKVETLSTFCSRLSLSNTSDQVQDDIKDLLANLDALSITH